MVRDFGDISVSFWGFLLLLNLFGIFIFDCMQVWDSFFFLFLLLLSLFCFFPVIFLDLRYIGMTCQSAVCARFVSLSHIHFYYICWCAIDLFWFILFWFIFCLFFSYGLVSNFFSSFFFFFLFFFSCLFLVGGGCVSRYMACTSIMYWKWVPSPPIPECMIVSVPWAKET